MSCKRGKRSKPTYFQSLGHTDRLSLYILGVIILTIFMGFYLACKSIQSNYIGNLVCFTITTTPLDAALSIVLSKIVDKNKAENTGGNGDGIKFAMAQASMAAEQNNSNIASPQI